MKTWLFKIFVGMLLQVILLREKKNHNKGSYLTLKSRKKVLFVLNFAQEKAILQSLFLKKERSNRIFEEKCLRKLSEPWLPQCSY